MLRAKVRKFLEHPIISLVFAGILVYSGLSEIWATLLEEFRSHHLVIGFGFWHVLKAWLDWQDGKEQLKKFFHPKKEKDK